MFQRVSLDWDGLIITEASHPLSIAIQNFDSNLPGGGICVNLNAAGSADRYWFESPLPDVFQRMFQGGLIASRQGLKSRETITRHGGKTDAAGKVIVSAASRALSISAVIESNLLFQHDGLCDEKNAAAVEVTPRGAGEPKRLAKWPFPMEAIAAGGQFDINHSAARSSIQNLYRGKI